MAVVVLKSTMISNRDSSPTLPTGASIAGGNIREFEGYVTTDAADSTGSTYIMGQVPSNSRVSSVILQSAALGAGCTVNVGVYAPTYGYTELKNLGYAASAPIAATLFASAESVATAVAPTEVINQSGNNSISNQELELWQACGLASDPNGVLDIVITLASATVNAALIGLKVRYVQ